MQAFSTWMNRSGDSEKDQKEVRLTSLIQLRGEFQTNLHEKRKPYTARKRKATFYRLVFFHLGALLLILSAVIFLRQPHWVLTNLYPMYCWILKGLVGAFAGFIGIASIVVGAYIKTETEAVFHLWHAAKKRLTGLYRSKLAALGASVLSPHLNHNPQLNSLRSRFLHCKEDLIEAHHKAVGMLTHLTSSSSFDASRREHLLNAALIDFEEELAQILTIFNTESL